MFPLWRIHCAMCNVRCTMRRFTGDEFMNFKLEENNPVKPESLLVTTVYPVSTGPRRVCKNDPIVVPAKAGIQ